MSARTPAHPIRSDPPAGPYPWRDNAYLGFWDPANEVYGAVHVSTSPNADGRRARASVSVRGLIAEVVEPLDPGTFTGKGIDFGLDGRIRVDTDCVVLDLQYSARAPVADYSTSGVISDLVPDEPLQHVQQAVVVTGGATVSKDGRSETAGVNGRGLRDRTWGYRDESVSMHEFVFLMAGIGDRDLAVVKFLHGDGSTSAEGFLFDSSMTAVCGLDVTWDPSGLISAARLEVADGTTLELRRTNVVGGFWVPMGVERSGPAMSCYDQFVEMVSSDGETGYGIFEAGIIRRLF